MINIISADPFSGRARDLKPSKNSLGGGQPETVNLLIGHLLKKDQFWARGLPGGFGGSTGVCRGQGPMLHLCANSSPYNPGHSYIYMYIYVYVYIYVLGSNLVNDQRDWIVRTYIGVI